MWVFEHVQCERTCVINIMKGMTDWKMMDYSKHNNIEYKELWIGMQCYNFKLSGCV